MKYLYYNGDSFCGDGIAERGGKTFGELLCDKYNLDIEEDWEGGSSNDRIFRTTTDYIMNNNSKLQDTLFLIGWSKPTRFEIYDSVNELYVQKGHSDFYHRPKKFWKEYIEYFLDIKQLSKEHEQRVFLLQSLFQNEGCVYLFFNIFNDSIIHKSNSIDFNSWVLPKSSFDQSLNSFKKEEVRLQWNDEENVYDDHPNELGHEKWFEVVSSVIDNKELL